MAVERRAPAPAGDAPVALSELQLTFEDGTILCSLQRDGAFRCGERLLGALSSDGTFTFDRTRGLVTVRLTTDGHLTIEAAEGADLDPLPGGLARLLHDQARVDSAYSIDADGEASLPRTSGRSIHLDDDGRLSDGVHTLRVRGLTPARRQTATFLYVLLSMVSP